MTFLILSNGYFYDPNHVYKRQLDFPFRIVDQITYMITGSNKKRTLHIYSHRVFPLTGRELSELRIFKLIENIFAAIHGFILLKNQKSNFST